MNAKRLLLLVLLASAAVLILVRPVEAATMIRHGVSEAGRLAGGAAQAFSTFLSTLF